MHSTVQFGRTELELLMTARFKHNIFNFEDCLSPSRESNPNVGGSP